MTTWLLILYFNTGMQATLQRPFASREACEIAVSAVTRRLEIAQAMHPERTVRLAHASCQPGPRP